jgi:hypothetical protein
VLSLIKHYKLTVAYRRDTETWRSKDMSYLYHRCSSPTRCCSRYRPPYERGCRSEGLGKSKSASSRRSARMRCSNVDDHAVRGVNVGRSHNCPRVAMMDEAEYSPLWLAPLVLHNALAHPGRDGHCGYWDPHPVERQTNVNAVQRCLAVGQVVARRDIDWRRNVVGKSACGSCWMWVLSSSNSAQCTYGCRG